MIVETKAIEPTPGKANSTYAAIIIGVEENSSSTILKFYCPDTMGNITLDEAKKTSTNILYVDTYLYFDEEHPEKNLKYNYKVGGLIMISYQNGNLSYPQFIRLIQIKDNIINANIQSIDSGIIMADEEDIGVSDTGSVLVGLIEKCFNDYRQYSGVSYIYINPKLNASSNIVCAVYKNGFLGTELVYKYNLNFPAQSEEYYNNPQNILNQVSNRSFSYYPKDDNDTGRQEVLYSNARGTGKGNVFDALYYDKKAKDAIVIYFNSAIRTMFTNKLEKGDNIEKLYFGLEDEKVYIFLIAQLLGYTYEDIVATHFPDSGIDTTIAPVTETQIKYLKNVFSDVVGDKSQSLNNNIYRPLKSILNMNMLNPHYEDDDNIIFLTEVWKYISNDDNIKTILADIYNRIFAVLCKNNTENIKSKTGLVCTVLSVIFPALRNVLIYLESYIKEYKSVSLGEYTNLGEFLNDLQECKNGKYKNKLIYDADNSEDNMNKLTKLFLQLYFYEIGIEVTDEFIANSIKPEFTEGWSVFNNMIKSIINTTCRFYNQYGEHPDIFLRL